MFIGYQLESSMLCGQCGCCTLEIFAIYENELSDNNSIAFVPSNMVGWWFNCGILNEIELVMRQKIEKERDKKSTNNNDYHKALAPIDTNEIRENRKTLKELFEYFINAYSSHFLNVWWFTIQMLNICHGNSTKISSSNALWKRNNFLLQW